MTASLEPMDPAHRRVWRERSSAAYIESRRASGESREQAEAANRRSSEQYFPGGELAEGHEVFDVVDEGERVGVLWIGVIDAAARAWYVYDIEIDEAFRGRGLGRQAMVLAEGEARARGAESLGLNVFGFNTVARNLYESLGYEPTAIQMRKPLA